MTMSDKITGSVSPIKRILAINISTPISISLKVDKTKSTLIVGFLISFYLNGIGSHSITTVQLPTKTGNFSLTRFLIELTNRNQHYWTVPARTFTITTLENRYANFNPD